MQPLTRTVFSKSPYATAVRVILLVAVGWGLLRAVHPAFDADKPYEELWPETDFSRRTVDISEIERGGPPKDGIPPIDEPRFTSAGAAREWLDPREPVVVVKIGAHSRAYPIQILVWHEIVNDTLAGTPIVVTFCPLCNASLVFYRTVDDRVLDFGTTGLLRRSDLVMYDRQTESWWQQFTGEAIVGDYAGTALRELPAGIVAFEDFATAHEHGEVLSRDTGQSRDYGNNPYQGYDTMRTSPLAFNGIPQDDRLPPMERVLAVRHGSLMRIYPFSEIRKRGIINDELGGAPVVVFGRAGTLSALDAREISRSRLVPSATAFRRQWQGQRLNFERIDDVIRDKETGSKWNMFGSALEGPLRGASLTQIEGGVHFAFAWLAFNPETEIYGYSSED